MKRIIKLLVLLTTVFGLFGCTGRESAQVDGITEDAVQEPEITVFDINSGDHKFDDRIAREIMARTGVKINIMDPTDDSKEKINLMLAYQDYPDMILISIESIGRFEEAGYLVDLQPYLDELPNVKGMYGDLLNRLRTKEGKLYYLSNWYGMDEDASSAFQIRYDYLCELVGKERADSDEPFTQEEFLDLLRIFKETYPEIDGEPSIPFCLSLNMNYSTPLQGMYGMKKYYEVDGSLYHLARHPKCLEMFRFLNQMYREGLLDKEWVTNRKALFTKKLTSGRVFATACAYWDLDEERSILRENGDEEAKFYSYKVLGTGIKSDETTYNARNSLGWDAIAVTDRCKDMDAVLKVIDFLASEEGQYLMMWGIEGEDWDYVDGVRTPKPELLKKVDEDINQTKEDTGIRLWTWFIKNGMGSDGSPYDMMTKYHISKEAELINRRMKTDLWDTACYANLEPPSGTREALIWKNAEDIYNRAYSKIVNASSASECDRLYNKMMEDMITEEVWKAEKVITDNYRKKLELWGKDQ